VVFFLLTAVATLPALALLVWLARGAAKEAREGLAAATATKG
jgi:hypothetical protein